MARATTSSSTRPTRRPIPADWLHADPRPVDGDDIDWAAASEMYAKEAVARARPGARARRAGRRRVADPRAVDEVYYGRNDDGTYGPGNDRYFTIGATEQRYPRTSASTSIAARRRGACSTTTTGTTATSSSTTGCGRHTTTTRTTGPFRVPGSAQTPLVVATTYDPATPYRGALRLVRDLGNARLITMRGDGHTAYGGESALHRPGGGDAT